MKYNTIFMYDTYIYIYIYIYIYHVYNYDIKYNVEFFI